MTFARRKYLTTHFSERIPIVKRRVTVFFPEGTQQAVEMQNPSWYSLRLKFTTSKHNRQRLLNRKCTLHDKRHGVNLLKVFPPRRSYHHLKVLPNRVYTTHWTADVSA